MLRLPSRCAALVPAVALLFRHGGWRQAEVLPIGAIVAPGQRTVSAQTVATAAWYRKRHPTFTDTRAAVRRQFWCEQGLFTSHFAAEKQKSQPALHKAIAHAICYAA